MEIFRVDLESGALSESELAACEAAVKPSELLVIPTDMAYGIASVFFESMVVQCLQGARGRGEDFPPPVLVFGVTALDSLSERPAIFGTSVPLYEAARWLATIFWPGPSTTTVRANPRLGQNLGKIGGTIALCQPSHPAALQVLEAIDPLAVTSANRHGAPPTTDISAATAYSWDKAAVCVDTDELPSDQPSMIVNLTRLDVAGQPVIARVGAVTAAEIRAVLGS